MSKYRSRLRIISDILKVARKRAKRTQIMYQANLSYRLMDRYLKEVLSAGLVECVNGNLYLVTKSGEDFLNRCIEYFEHQKKLERELDEIQLNKEFLEKMCTNNIEANRNLDNLQVKNYRRKLVRE